MCQEPSATQVRHGTVNKVPHFWPMMVFFQPRDHFEDSLLTASSMIPICGES